MLFLFFCSGRGKGESEAPGEGGGGIGFFIENPRRGGGFSRMGEGFPGGLFGANWGIGGGGG